MIADLMAEVEARVDDAMPELLPMLLEKLVRREGLNPCRRHQVLLGPYVQAQIHLHHCRKRFNNWDGHITSDTYWATKVAENEGMICRILSPETAFNAALTTRDKARRTYRSEPCTCWVQHR